MTDKKRSDPNMGADQELGSAPIGKLMARLAIPTVVAQVVNLLYNIVDRIYIGHIPEIGAEALTGVGLFMPIFMLINAFSMLTGVGLFMPVFPEQPFLWEDRTMIRRSESWVTAFHC